MMISPFCTLGRLVEDALCTWIVEVEVVVCLTEPIVCVTCFITHCFKPEITFSITQRQTKLEHFLQFPRRDSLVKTQAGQGFQ